MPGPFEAWLLLRGMRTLFLRVRQSSASALAIAEHFPGHPRLAAVLYPGLGRAIPAMHRPARQMRDGFGGMLSLRVKGGREAALAVAARVQALETGDLAGRGGEPDRASRQRRGRL